MHQKDNQSNKKHPVTGAMKRILATPDGQTLAAYMAGVIVAPSYQPNISHDDMLHVEGQRTAFRQLLSFAGHGALQTNEIIEQVVEGADNE